MGEVYIPSGTPDISAARLPGMGPAGCLYLQSNFSPSSWPIISVSHEQNRDDREFRLQWTRYIHWPRYLEERMHRVVDPVRPEFAVRALFLHSAPKRFVRSGQLAEPNGNTQFNSTYQVVRVGFRRAVETLVPDANDWLIKVETECRRQEVHPWGGAVSR